MKNLFYLFGVVVFSAFAAVVLLTIAPAVIGIIAGALLPMIGICALLFPLDWEKAKNGDL